MSDDVGLLIEYMVRRGYLIRDGKGYRIGKRPPRRQPMLRVIWEQMRQETEGWNDNTNGIC